jgi:hypothetical protein
MGLVRGINGVGDLARPALPQPEAKKGTKNLGTKKNARTREREPWDLMEVRRARGYPLHIPCTRCGKPAQHRYWNPHTRAGVCLDCLPLGIRPPRIGGTDPDQRPRALG